MRDEHGKGANDHAKMQPKKRQHSIQERDARRAPTLRGQQRMRRIGADRSMLWVVLDVGEPLGRRHDAPTGC